MVAVASNQLYDQVVDVTREYLGPAADRFIARQITNHLQIAPEDLANADLRKLIDWLKLSMAFLTNDELLIERYISELKTIARIKPARKSSGGTRYKPVRSAVPYIKK